MSIRRRPGAFVLAVWVVLPGAGCAMARSDGHACGCCCPMHDSKGGVAVPERTGVITMKGKPMTLVGREVKVGSPAPAFTLTANDLSDLESSRFRGKVLVLSVVPSLDTGVCAIQTRKFNERATSLSADVVVLTVSMDLPFAQKRFCGAEGIERVVTASDYKHRTFGESFGVHIKELGLLARSVFVVDRAGKVVYAQYVPEMTTEPDYDAAMSAVHAALR